MPTNSNAEHQCWLYLQEKYIVTITNDTGVTIAAPRECRTTNEHTDGSHEYRLEWYHQKDANNRVYMDLNEHDLINDRWRPSFDITRITAGTIVNKKFTTNAFLFYLNHQIQVMTDTAAAATTKS